MTVPTARHQRATGSCRPMIDQHPESVLVGLAEDDIDALPVGLSGVAPVVKKYCVG